MDEFGYTTDIEVRYRDLDTMGHVNNAIYVTFLEQSRVDYFEDVLGISPTDISGVIAHLEIDYLRSITAEDDVTVAMRVTDMGTTSVTMEQEIRAGGEPAATAEIVQVVFDENGEEPRPIPSEWRDRITTHEGL
ncbi:MULTISPECIES: thioesterase family protein [unclassified Haladaptatus]|uniref:acyl-CoA thioesterase n=1 Tax=unclassified Haladaptatus TaxID=2622732 RepID=UPI00209C224E|nr:MULTISPECIES: thioesterase family protein [unclassified Haladaptatus]MCO8246423.1 acyl-CoA thioesterase [Haladaptatus sp. AB643]MCO8254660.1 acyl-CoA thioesterase [Haladaptatus sp. AB618]